MRITDSMTWMLEVWDIPWVEKFGVLFRLHPIFTSKAYSINRTISISKFKLIASTPHAQVSRKFKIPLGDFPTPVNICTFLCMMNWFCLLIYHHAEAVLEAQVLWKKSFSAFKMYLCLCCSCHHLWLRDQLFSCWGSLKENDSLFLCYTWV